MVLSAQICPAVPLALIAAGFRPIFADVEADLPVAGWKSISGTIQAAGGTGQIAAVLVAANYGHLPDATAAQLDAIGDSALVLDLAQGALLAPAIPLLAARADAFVYSFGLGKGIDIGGGMLASRIPLSANASPAGSRMLHLRTAAQALVLRAIVAVGAYRHLAARLDGAQDAAKEALGALDELAPGLFRQLLPERLHAFAAETALARVRATALLGDPGIAERLAQGTAWTRPTAAHLRQMIRLRDAGRRDRLVRELRSAGVDCAPAGEPLPDTYLDRDAFAGTADWPNAQQFRADAIRLPFLGRLDETQFGHVRATLEKYLG